MVRKLLILAGGLAFACGSPAWADANNSTELATYTQPGPGGATFTGIDLTGSGGATFINQYNGATPFAPGSNFKSLGAIPLQSIVTNPGAVNQPAAASGQLVAIFALQGTNNLTNAGQVNFNQGVVAIYRSNAAFSATNLTTWGFPGTASATGGALGLYVLKPPETVNQGNPAAYSSIGSSPSTINNAVVPGATRSITGTTLFRDAGTVAGTTFTPTADVFATQPIPPATTPGRTTDGLNPAPGPNTFLLPGFVADFSDGFQNSSNPNFDPTGAAAGSTLTAAQIAANLATANAIFTALGTDPGLTLPGGTALPGSSLLLDGGFGFATGFGSGPATNYNPNLSGNPFTSTTGDFPAQTATQQGAAPTFEPTTFSTGTTVPEIDPSSIAGALTLLGGGLMLLTGRRYRKAK